MKHMCLTMLFLVFYVVSYAGATSYNVRQNGWRWRNNDGSETTATWKAAQNTAITYNSSTEPLRLRVQIVNTSTATGAATSTITMIDSLQVSTTPTVEESWINIGLDSRKPFKMAGTSTFVNQDQATTSQITGNSNTFTAGKMMVSDSVLKTTTIATDRRSEFEWVIIGTANIASNTTYYFRQRRRYTTAAATQYPIAYPSLSTDVTTSVAELYYPSGISLPYPNPALSAVHFQLTKAIPGLLQAILYDAAGRPVQQQEFRNLPAGSRQTLPFRGAPVPGVYFLKLYGDRIRETMRVVIR